MKTKAILIGGSSRVGEALAQELALIYESVILITRTQPRAMSANMQVYHVADFRALASTIEAMAIGADTDAFSCLGVSKQQVPSHDEFYQVNVLYNLEFAKACKQKGVQQFYFLSKDGADAPNHDDELTAKADVEYYLRTLSFDTLAIFRLHRLTLPKQRLSLKSLGSQALNGALSVLTSKNKRALEPKQVAACMALTAYEHNHQPQLRTPNQATIITHEQMLKSLIRPNKKSK
ncbi:NAD-dependent epimerase/dehydratase family protein [Moraxella canis]|uniref:NAD-dependent epimerase/dehydratase family protein n=1 Tax=Moraxella canis TaxID=90239 RepID=A0ABZ0WY42_9GAMM|nr:NAD-dependent epimerase/dehydratase family protein [Moraxella canis]WQE04167.1 NAD-dependent epimerase/dehydratase family protein [Moraxella canis]